MGHGSGGGGRGSKKCNSGVLVLIWQVGDRLKEEVVLLRWLNYAVLHC